MPYDMIIRIHELSHNKPMGIEITNRNEIEIKKKDDGNDYNPSNKRT